MKNKNKNYLKKMLLDLLPDNYAERKTSKELCRILGLSFRNLKELVTELRVEYPICAVQIGRGGYWISNDKREIKEFIKMIEARKEGYEKTIAVMQNHYGPTIIN